MFLLKLLLVLYLGHTVRSHDLNVGLKFGDDDKSYIRIDYDMSPVSEQLSVCAWIKQLRTDPIEHGWLHYKTSEAHDSITISDNLNWANVAGRAAPRGDITPMHSEWYHVCLTYSYANKEMNLYFNGKKVGSNTAQAKLSVAEGSIVIGQHQNTLTKFNSNYHFGGEMTKMNMFSRSLTEKEVADMYSSGICSNYEDSLSDDTFLSWDTLLDDGTEKHGNIAKFRLTDCPDHTHTQMPTTENPTEEAEDECSKHWEFLNLAEFKEQKVTSERIQDMKERLDLLAEFEGHEIDSHLVEYLIKHHCDMHSCG